MLEKLKELIKFGSEHGWYFPVAHDAISGKPSITLFFTNISFYLAIISLIALHFNDKLLTASGACIGLFAVCTIFYMIRKINKAKVDLDDKSLELENNEKE